MPTVVAASLGPVQVVAETDVNGNVLSATVVRQPGMEGTVDVVVRDSSGTVKTFLVTALSVLPAVNTFTANRRPHIDAFQVELRWGRG